MPTNTKPFCLKATPGAGIYEEQYRKHSTYTKMSRHTEEVILPEGVIRANVQTCSFLHERGNHSHVNSPD